MKRHMWQNVATALVADTVTRGFESLVLAKAVRHGYRREKAPRVKQGADPARDDPDPHCSLRATDVNVLLVILRCGTKDVPARSALETKIREENERYLPVCEEHTNIHRTHDEDNVEPRVLQAQVSKIPNRF